MLEGQDEDGDDGKEGDSVGFDVKVDNSETSPLDNRSDANWSRQDQEEEKE
jgi:hypothetical protein